MPLGLDNAPSVIQVFINKLLCLYSAGILVDSATLKFLFHQTSFSISFTASYSFRYILHPLLAVYLQPLHVIGIFLQNRWSGQTKSQCWDFMGRKLWTLPSHSLGTVRNVSEMMSKPKVKSHVPLKHPTLALMQVPVLLSWLTGL